MFFVAAELNEYKRNVQATLKQRHKEQPSKKTNVRGKDRLMKAATKSNHVHFNDSSDEETDVVKENDAKLVKEENKKAVSS